MQIFDYVSRADSGHFCEIIWIIIARQRRERAWRKRQLCNMISLVYTHACSSLAWRSAIDKRNLFPFYVPVSPIINCYAMSAAPCARFTVARAPVATPRMLTFFREGGAFRVCRNAARASKIVAPRIINYTG